MRYANQTIIGKVCKHRVALPYVRNVNANANANVNAASGLDNGPIGVNANVNVNAIELTGNFDIPSQV